MDPLWRSILWSQFGATIDMLDQALVVCPDTLWTQRLWNVPPSEEFPPEFSEFWYLAYHTIVWLDLYLTGAPEEEFAPPAPFVRGVIDSAEARPIQPYTKEQLRTYLASTRQKVQTTLAALTDEQARRPIEYPWMREGEVVTYVELQVYCMRHVQDHVAQLNLFLGQHGVPGEQLDWVTRVTDQPSGG